jgi:hypothetical protein
MHTAEHPASTSNISAALQKGSKAPGADLPRDAMASCVQDVWRSRQNAAMMLDHVDQFFRDAIGAGPKGSMQVQSKPKFVYVQSFVCAACPNPNLVSCIM